VPLVELLIDEHHGLLCRGREPETGQSHCVAELQLDFDAIDHRQFIEVVVFFDGQQGAFLGQHKTFEVGPHVGVAELLLVAQHVVDSIDLDGFDVYVSALHGVFDGQQSLTQILVFDVLFELVVEQNLVHVERVVPLL